MAAVRPDVDQSFAERLRGRRFWMPLAILVVVTVVGVVMFERSTSSSPSSPSAASTLHGLGKADPGIRDLLTRLQPDHLFCGAPQVPRRGTATCLFGAASARTAIVVFPTHRVLLQTMGTLERASRSRFAKTGKVDYLVTGDRWMFWGIWSPTGHYNQTGTPDAQTAQTISKRLNGCLELLPREAGSCAF